MYDEKDTKVYTVAFGGGDGGGGSGRSGGSRGGAVGVGIDDFSVSRTEREC